MTIRTRQSGATHPYRRESSIHLFAVGQTVRLRRSSATSPKVPEMYQITGKLPPKGHSPQYRIRNDDERHERVTTQDDIEAIDTVQADSGATLIERTFGHAQGTETQQSRDQKAETGQGSAEA